MNMYERLQDQACADGIDVMDYHFSSERIKGLYCNGSIAIRHDIPTQAEKSCVLAEELGHYYTTTGNILEQSVAANRKQELRARAYGYNLRIGLRGIVAAYEAGCQNQYEIAEHLGVTEEYLIDALEYYRSKYGIYATIDNYVIYFEPLAVAKMMR